MSYCGRCGREVYCAERKFAIGKIWHTFCFSCYKCRKLLDNCSVCSCNGELFCLPCYQTCCCPLPCKPCGPCPPPPCCVVTSDTCDPCCTSGCSDESKTCKVVCIPRCGPCPVPCCDPCDPCNPCCTPVPCKPCKSPCCTCCGKIICEPCCPTENYCLRKTSKPPAPCRNKILCLDDCELPSLLSRCPPCTIPCTPSSKCDCEPPSLITRCPPCTPTSKCDCEPPSLMTKCPPCTTPCNPTSKCGCCKKY